MSFENCPHREYLGKQLQKEDDGSNQVGGAGPAVIQGKA